MLPTVSCPILAPEAFSNLPCLARLSPAPFPCRFPVFPSAAPTAQCTTTTSFAFRPRSRGPSLKTVSKRSHRAREARQCRHPFPHLSPEPPPGDRTPTAASSTPPLPHASDAPEPAFLVPHDEHILITPPVHPIACPCAPLLLSMHADHHGPASRVYKATGLIPCPLIVIPTPHPHLCNFNQYPNLSHSRWPRRARSPSPGCSLAVKVVDNSGHHLLPFLLLDVSLVDLHLPDLSIYFQEQPSVGLASPRSAAPPRAPSRRAAGTVQPRPYRFFL